MAKLQYELEFHLNTSPKVLYPRLSTADGLNEWFADYVKIEGKTCTFRWQKEEREAELLQLKELKSAKYHWNDEDDDSFFEFRLETTELTDDLALKIIDFAEDDELDEAKDLWNAQIADLKRVLGA